MSRSIRGRLAIDFLQDHAICRLKCHSKNYRTIIACVLAIFRGAGAGIPDNTLRCCLRWNSRVELLLWSRNSFSIIIFTQTKLSGEVGGLQAARNGTFGEGKKHFELFCVRHEVLLVKSRV